MSQLYFTSPEAHAFLLEKKSHLGIEPRIRELVKLLQRKIDKLLSCQRKKTD
jgi:hypothetical protein